jgi:hypothetical protein
MKWYEILGIIMVWVVGLYGRGRFYESMKDYFYKVSWKTKGKKLKRF